MRLLLIDRDSEDSIDQVLMVVEDDYDKAKAIEEAENYIGEGAYIQEDVELDVDKYAFSTWRPYIG